jgi:hypothetical protein
MKLAVITPFYNPCGYSRIRSNYFEYVAQFEQWGLRQDLFTIELILDGDQPVGADLQYRGKRPNHCMWQKENMITSTVKQLPSCYDTVAWVDADILFQNSDWVSQLEAAIAKHKLVQLFEYADLLGLDRKPVLHRKSVTACKQSGTHAQGAWGMAWAMRRDCFESLPWMFVAGGGDVHAAKGWFGLRLPSFGNATNLSREYVTWTKQQKVKSIRDVSYLPQRVQHLYHGDRANRRYMFRDTLLQRHRFDPNKDVIRDAQNAFATCSWSDTELPLSKEVRLWFTERKEDA